MSNSIIHNKIVGNLEYAISEMKAGRMIKYTFEIDMPYSVRYFCKFELIKVPFGNAYTIKVEGIDLSTGMKYASASSYDSAITTELTDKMIINSMADVIYKRMSIIRNEVKKIKKDKERATMLDNLKNFCNNRPHEFKFGCIPDSVEMDDGILCLDAEGVVEPVFKVSNGDQLPEESVEDFVKNGIEFIKMHSDNKCEYRRKVDDMIFRLTHDEGTREISLDKFDRDTKSWKEIAGCSNYNLAVGLEQSFIFAINDIRFRRFVHGYETPDTNFTTEDNEMELTYDRIYNDILDMLKVFLDDINILCRKRMTRSIIPGTMNMYAFETRREKTYFEFSIYESDRWWILYSVDYANGNVPVEKLADLFATTICNRFGIDIPEKKDFEQKYWDAQRDIDGYCREIDDLKHQVESLTKINRDGAKQVDELFDKNEDANRKNRELNFKLNKSYDACESRDITIAKLKNENSDLEKELYVEKKKHQKATELCKMNADIIADLKLKYDRKSEAYSDLLVKYRNLERSNWNLRSTIDFAYKAIKGLIDNNKLFGDDIQILKENLECQASIDLVDDKD